MGSKLAAMKSLESHLAPTGTTTVPKALRSRLNAPLGGRLVWTLHPDGLTLQARLRYADEAPTEPQDSTRNCRVSPPPST